ncbi:hypothetical protein M408DRAFT_253307 [Serendipita vermifera MAFF 305830]|uniref:Uncharacterized protein n=1 Tax=Serendipita vermifera MAFF 305830 TaxID=933852 RepID=A0A0C2WAX0_SERVB|nr:hypothetical protein M408DRAFT_253307 [Serendipita vermifera MAFF 305830]
MWSATERTWKLIVLDPSRASLPPVGDIILWEAERRSWRLTWSVEAMGNSGLKLPSAVWSAKQEAWILES